MSREVTNDNFITLIITHNKDLGVLLPMSCLVRIPRMSLNEPFEYEVQHIDECNPKLFYFYSLQLISLIHSKL